jgi:hypothetical protein
MAWIAAITEQPFRGAEHLASHRLGTEHELGIAIAIRISGPSEKTE